MDNRDNTFTLLTPPGEGGIAVFALRGPDVRALLAQAVRAPRLAALASGELAYGRLLSASGEVLDEVIVAALGASGDGAEDFELHCHAGGAAAAAAADRLVELGFREASVLPDGPGLSPDEAWRRRALTEVRTRRQLETLLAVRGGRPDELARAVLATHRVIIAGPVNAGKSTLFNRLAGYDRAITSPHPGTTRDAVEAEVAVRGLAVELVDTAGLGRVEGDSLAADAQEHARAEAAAADLLLVVLDASAPVDRATLAELELMLAAARRSVVVLNKCDAPQNVGADPGLAPLTRNASRPVHVSALTGQGIEELAERMEAALLPPHPAVRPTAP